MTEYRKGESGDAVVRAVAAQRSKLHRGSSDPRSRHLREYLLAAVEATSGPLALSLPRRP